MEAICDDVAVPLGFSSFAPVIPARGSTFTAARRSGNTENLEGVVSEEDLHGK
jgi:hypothetical protein